jgi:hypothetical protein
MVAFYSSRRAEDPARAAGVQESMEASAGSSENRTRHVQKIDERIVKMEEAEGQEALGSELIVTKQNR